MGCEQCGKALSGQQKRFCSHTCWYESNRYEKTAICVTCGNTFEKKYRKQIACSVDCGNRAKSANKTVICQTCNTEFERPHGKMRMYCSRTCAMTGRYRKGQIRQRAEGETISHSSGYIQQKSDGKWIMQHRLVMEQIIGRPLKRDERVHHKNGNRQDNRPENLELWVGVERSKKDPHGVRLVDQVIDMLSSLQQHELLLIRQVVEEKLNENHN